MLKIEMIDINCAICKRYVMKGTKDMIKDTLFYCSNDCYRVAFELSSKYI
jgi:hypothetical protein